MGEEAAAVTSTSKGGVHPLIAQLLFGMRSCTLSRFIILYGRLLTLFNTPSAAASLLSGSSVMGAFSHVSSLHLRKLPMDFVTVQTPAPPPLLHNEDILEHQARTWMPQNVMGNGAGGAVLAPADGGDDADTMVAAVGNNACCI